MPLMLMSNPGLSLALLGNPRRHRNRRAKRHVHHRAKRRAHRRVKHHAHRRVHHRTKRRARRSHHLSRFLPAHYRRIRVPRRHRSHTRTNPMMSPTRALKGYFTAVRSAPKTALGVFKGKGMVKNALFAAGGAAGTLVLGRILSNNAIKPAIAKLGLSAYVADPAAPAPNTTARVIGRVVYALPPITAGYIASKFAKGKIGHALLVGGSVASLIELVAPGMLGDLLKKTGIPGLSGYVSAPSYAGVGAYVSDQNYRGVGAYVSDQNYRGVGEYAPEMDGVEDVMAGLGDGDDDAVLAGVDGYLQDSGKYMASYLN